MSWAFLSYALFCNYSFELTIFHMPNAIKLRNWSTWLLLFLFFNSSFCEKMRSDVAFFRLLEISEAEHSNYSLASVKHLGLRRRGWSSLLMALLGQALAAVAPRSRNSCQLGTHPQWDSPCCPYWNLCCKSICCVFSPNDFPSWSHQRSSLRIWGAKHSACAFLAAALVQKMQCCSWQHQGSSEIAGKKK